MDFKSAVSAFIGVNPGYQGDAAPIDDPDQAAQRVRDAIGACGLEGEVYPGLVIYEVERGCPRGGEPIGAVFARQAGPITEILDRFDNVRANLSQATVSVIAPPDSGTVMPGFVVDFGEDDLDALARRWQELSAHDSRLSGALFKANGRVYGQAEANPRRVRDAEKWVEDATALIRQIKPGAEPLFRDVGYHYLREPG